MRHCVVPMNSELRDRAGRAELHLRRGILSHQRRQGVHRLRRERLQTIHRRLEHREASREHQKSGLRIGT